MKLQSVISQQVLMFVNEYSTGWLRYKSPMAPRGTVSKADRRAADKAQKAFWRAARNTAREKKLPLPTALAPLSRDTTSRQTFRRTSRKLNKSCSPRARRLCIAKNYTDRYIQEIIQKNRIKA